MNWAAVICRHWRAKKPFSRSRSGACRGANTASGHSRQTHGLAGARLALGAAQPGPLIGAGVGEHVPLAAGEFGEYTLAELQGSDQLRAAARQGGGLFPGDHYRWLRSPGQVVLGVFGDGVHGVALRGVVAVR